jgi:hypothetical protein
MVDKRLEAEQKPKPGRESQGFCPATAAGSRLNFLKWGTQEPWKKTSDPAAHGQGLVRFLIS